jgi:uncharacterized protein YbjT (DUF2867 family)
MSAKTAAIIGVTGLIGGYLYEIMKQDKTYETIRLIVRRPLAKDSDRTDVKLVDFNDAESFKLAIDGSDVVFCAIGTTQKKVKGDKVAYRKIDSDIPVKAASFCKETGCETFVLVSSVGATSKSKTFYLKLKGEVEDAVKAVGLRSVHIMRPSMLLGDRKEFRLGEKIGSPVMRGISFLLPSKFKPIQAKAVAIAMLNAVKENKEGFFVYEYNEIRKLSR